MGKKKIIRNPLIKKEPPLVINPNEFEGLMGFEEMSNCTLMQKNKYGGVKKTVLVDGKVVKKKKKKKNKKEKQKNDLIKAELVENINTDNENINKSPTSKDKVQKEKRKEKLLNKLPLKKKIIASQPFKEEELEPKQKTQKETFSQDEGKEITGMDSWKSLFTPEPVIKALAKLGFKEPTEIQRLSLPAAIKGRKDIIGAAETGSGKTLAFGIPVISGILKDFEIESQKVDSGVESSENDSDVDMELEMDDCGIEEIDPEDIDMDFEGNSSDDEDTNNDLSNKKQDMEVDDLVEDFDDEFDENEEDDDTNSLPDEVIEGDGIGCVKVIDNAVFDFLKPGEQEGIPNKKPSKPLRALIIEPTRELAIQVKSHLDAVLKHTHIRTVVVVGGVAQEKQERLLKRCPEIVIGTPGRLWEMVSTGNPHFAELENIRYLVIDETDRMVETGHFQELKSLLDIINSNEETKEKRQTFVYSATLTMVHKTPQRIAVKKIQKQKMNSTMKIEKLAKIIGVKPKPKIIDVTQKFGTAQSLTEGRIHCTKEEKDIYLYYFLNQHPGRTLVFSNSIDCVRRLQNLFTVLQCKPQSLHASMQQKQRLKSLERFSSNPRALLLATDVAARGLDIQNIQHVIHYQVPRTAETYVHRSGRTARAYQEGLSILLVEPSEQKKYSQLCTTLNRDSELPPFPIDMEMYKQIAERVKFGREIELKEHRVKKAKVDEDWWKKAAKEAELIYEPEEVEEDYDGLNRHNEVKAKRELKYAKDMLNNLLSQPIMPSQYSGSYPTQSGSLILPVKYNMESKNKESDALSLMKSEKTTYKELSSKVKIKPVTLENKKKKKKFKGFQRRKEKLKKEKELYKKEQEQLKNNS